MFIETYGVELGDMVKDRISGFSGRVVAISQYQTGCARVGVQAGLDKDGKIPDAQWFDATMVDKIEGIEPLLPRVVETPAPAYAGGPQAAPPSRPNPTQR